jgi:hypothetical protein
MYTIIPKIRVKDKRGEVCRQAGGGRAGRTKKEDLPGEAGPWLLIIA